MTSRNNEVLRAAVGQFPVVEDWETNASVAGRLIDEAESTVSNFSSCLKVL